MSLAGQWIAQYAGSNSGLLVAEFDEVGDHYEGTICVWDNKLEYPKFWVYINTVDKQISQSFKGLPVNLVDNSGAAFSNEAIRELSKTVALPQSADCEIDMKGDELIINWKTPIGTFGSTTAPKTKSKRTSELKPLPISTWEDFKSFVKSLDRTRYIFRGHSNNKWRLCTSFHRTRRASVQRYAALDVNELHRVISAQTTMFHFGDPLQFAAFLNLTQHHGYPTPLLDWTRSPYVAAFFAYRSLPKYTTTSLLADRKTRIFKLDAREWNKLSRVDKIFPATPNMTILSTLAMWNQRAIPQQALSTYTNVADLESYIKSVEDRDNKVILR
jgi:hypothetical protein